MLWAAAVAVAVIVATNTGCATVKSNVTPEKMANAIEVAATYGAREAMSRDPNARAYFQAAEVVVSSLVNSGTYDSQSLTDSLNAISVKELRDSAQVKNAIKAVLDLYSAFEGDNVTQGINHNAYLSQALKALDTGLKNALQ